MAMTKAEQGDVFRLQQEVLRLREIIRAVGEPNLIVARTSMVSGRDIGIPDTAIVRFVLGDHHENYADVSIDQPQKGKLLVRTGRLCSIQPQAANTFLVQVEDK